MTGPGDVLPGPAAVPLVIKETDGVIGIVKIAEIKVRSTRLGTAVDRAVGTACGGRPGHTERIRGIRGQIAEGSGSGRRERIHGRVSAAGRPAGGKRIRCLQLRDGRERIRPAFIGPGRRGISCGRPDRPGIWSIGIPGRGSRGRRDILPDRTRMVSRLGRYFPRDPSGHPHTDAAKGFHGG